MLNNTVQKYFEFLWGHMYDLETREDFGLNLDKNINRELKKRNKLIKMLYGSFPNWGCSFEEI
tara:strand:+ start:2287 stop:2475 length:189 start_codon:yes stop_codon:yes gene_type:complete